MFPGKVVVITGGLSGIGLETTRAMATAGCRIYATTRNVSKGEKEVEKIR